MEMEDDIRDREGRRGKRKGCMHTIDRNVYRCPSVPHKRPHASKQAPPTGSQLGFSRPRHLELDLGSSPQSKSKFQIETNKATSNKKKKKKKKDKSKNKVNTVNIK